MSLNTRTIVLFGLIAALVVGLAVTAFREDPLSVDLAEIQTGSLTVTVNAEGRTRIRETYDVSSPISGTLLRLPLDVGDPVIADQTVVAEVQPTTAPLLDARTRAEAVASLHESEAAIRFAEAEVTRTAAELDFAQVQFERSKALVESGAATMTRMEDDALRLSLAEAAARSAEARVAMARAALERAEAVLSDPVEANDTGGCCVRLRAPADGVVLTQESRSARPVQPGEFLLRVGDPTDLEVVVDLLSADATRLVEGATAHLDRWGGPEALEAELARIEPTARTVVSALGIEEQRVDAVLDITSPRELWSGLGEGFAVFVRIEEWRIDDAVLIPLSAVYQREGEWFTFVDNDGVAEERPIRIGRRDGRQAVVLEGVVPGERVVTHPPDTIADGVSIAERIRF